MPVVRQSRLLSLSRSTAYYTPRGESEEDLTVMKEIDRLYMERPTSGSRTIKSMLKARGRKIARSRVVRLMRLMGLRAIYPKRRTSSPGEGHRIYPYLLRSMKVTRTPASLCGGHYVHPYGERLSLSRGRNRLA